MKNISYSWIDYLHFNNEEPTHNMEAIRAMHSFGLQAMSRSLTI
jgi:hypothetical protein